MKAPLAPAILSGLIAAIYDCALDPGQWEAVLERLRLELDFANAAMMLMALPEGTVLLNITSGISPHWRALMDRYGADVVEQWGGAAAVANYSINEPVVLSHERPPEMWAGNRYFVEWAKPQGLVDVMALALMRDAAMIGSIGMGRHGSAGRIAEAEIDAARLVLPHLQKAVAISSILDLQAVTVSSFSATLDAVTAAVILVDSGLRVVHANRAGEAMLASGTPLSVSGGALHFANDIATAALAAAVRNAGATEPGIEQARQVAAWSLGPTLLHVLPLRHGELRPGLMPRAVAAVFVAPSARTRIPPSETLSTLFGLTGTEGRVLWHIASGLTIAQTAAGMGLGASTVKTHLLRVFAKTGTARQAELIALVNTLGASV